MEHDGDVLQLPAACTALRAAHGALRGLHAREACVRGSPASPRTHLQPPTQRQRSAVVPQRAQVLPCRCAAMAPTRCLHGCDSLLSLPHEQVGGPCPRCCCSSAGSMPPAGCAACCSCRRPVWAPWVWARRLHSCALAPAAATHVMAPRWWSRATRNAANQRVQGSVSGASAQRDESPGCAAEWTA